MKKVILIILMLLIVQLGHARFESEFGGQTYSKSQIDAIGNKREIQNFSMENGKYNLLITYYDKKENSSKFFETVLNQVDVSKDFKFLGYSRFKTEKNEIIRDVVYLDFRKDTVVVCRQLENCFLRLNIPTDYRYEDLEKFKDYLEANDYSSENLIQYLLKEYYKN
ncbi:MAG: hypothetical protein ACRC0F_05125 [Cetobacterium sp.]